MGRAEAFDGHAGLHISALYSPFPGARWSVLAREFIAAKAGGPDDLLSPALSDQWRSRAQSRWQGISFLVSPTPDHSLFEQSVLEHDVGQCLLEGGRFGAELLPLGAARLARGIAGQALG